jgi:hypothetical protein
MSEQQAPDSEISRTGELLDLTTKAAGVYGRADLVKRLQGVRCLLMDSSVTVHVVGELKQGKSSLVNALLGERVCPVDDDVSTAVPTVVHFATDPTACVEHMSAENSREPLTERIPPESVPWLVSAANEDTVSVRIGLNNKFLAGGLTLVDTPGLNGHSAAHNTLLPHAHATLFVTDASQELTNSETASLRSMREMSSTIYFVLTKIDMYPQWRRVLDADLALLEADGLRVTPFAVSATLQAEAGRRGDPELHEKSGFGPLLAELTRAGRDVERTAARCVTNHVLTTVDDLDAVLRSRRQALAGRHSESDLAAVLAQTRDRASRLMQKSARWQQLLYDGFAGVTSDVDFDMGLRIRAVLTEAEKAIEKGNPTKNWAEFEAWLRRRLAGETRENYALLVSSTRELAAKVAAHLEVATSTTVQTADIPVPIGVADTLQTDTPFMDKRSSSNGGLTVFMRAYFGFMMFTMLITHVLQISLPRHAEIAAGLGAAVLMGGFGLGEERKRRLEKRRSQAKTTVRSYIDQFALHVSKDARDVLRRIQRELRDEFTASLTELQRSMDDAVRAAEAAIDSAEESHEELAQIETDVASLAELRERASALSPPQLLAATN